MAGTNIVLIDNNSWHDHTYEGNGCPNIWDASIPDTFGGSDKSCSTNLDRTADGEDLPIGTYYNFQAVTSGSGMNISVQNDIAEDSFCPLGWQLPYVGTGGDYYDKSRSWIYLLDSYSIVSSRDGSTALRSYPLSYILAGGYYLRNGRLFQLGDTGVHWSPANGPQEFNAFRFIYGKSGIMTNNAAGKNDSYALRCVKFLASIRRRHGGRNKYCSHR